MPKFAFVFLQDDPDGPRCVAEVFELEATVEEAYALEDELSSRLNESNCDTNTSPHGVFVVLVELDTSTPDRLRLYVDEAIQGIRREESASDGGP